MPTLRELENALLELKSKGITLNRKERGKMGQEMAKDLQDNRRANPSGFSRMLTKVKDFMTGPGREIASIVKIALSLL